MELGWNEYKVLCLGAGMDLEVGAPYKVLGIALEGPGKMECID